MTDRRWSSPVFRLKGHLDAILTGAKYLITPRATVRYPEEVIELPEGYRGFIEYKKDICISCGLCATVCPANAMKMYVERAAEPGEEAPAEEVKPKRYPGINYTRCIFCGFCVDVCPTGALEHVETHDVAYEDFNSMIYPPGEFAAGPPKPEFDTPPRRLRPTMDERRGIAYEPAD